MDDLDFIITADIESAARFVNVSVPHFRHIFHRSTGTPFATWQREKRFEIAVQLLRETQLPIREIVSRIGVRDPSHFTRSFKSRYGCTPAAFRSTIQSIGVHRRSSAA